MAKIMYVLTETGSEFQVIEGDDGQVTINRMSIMSLRFQRFVSMGVKIVDGPAKGRPMHGTSDDGGNWCTSNVLRVTGPAYL